MKKEKSLLASYWNSKGLPWCITWQPSTSEYIVYPRGESTSHPDAYFTDCPDDAVETAFLLVNGRLSDGVLVDGGEQ